MNTPVFVSIKLIDPNPNQEGDFDQAKILEIRESLQQHRENGQKGLLQIPTARQAAGGRYQLAFGHHRLEAFKQEAAKDSFFAEMPIFIQELTDRQMFEAMGVENLQRRDIGPIEIARTFRNYMTKFNVNSVETAKVFHKSDEYVRSMIRLLNLPEVAQTKLNSGAINITAGRALLSMQKVASPEAMAKTIEKIEKHKENALPEDIVNDAIDHLPNVVEMWDGDRREGKPRSSYNGNGWLLDMKNFPNNLLPAMSEQQVGVYESQIDHLVNPPACTACPFYTKVSGRHYCGMKFCHSRKTVAWQRYLIDQASKNLKIAVYTDEDGSFAALDSSYRTHHSLFEKRDKHLRLLPKDKARGYIYQYSFKGIETSVFFVAAVGAALSKVHSNEKPSGGKKSEKEKAEMRMKRVYRVRRKEFLWEFTAVAKSIFDGVPVAAVKEIQGWHFVGVDDSIPDEWLKGKRATAQVEADFERRELIWRLVIGHTSHYRRESMADILEKLREDAKAWGVKIPARLTKLAEQFDAEIEAAGERKPK